MTDADQSQWVSHAVGPIRQRNPVTTIGLRWRSRASNTHEPAERSTTMTHRRLRIWIDMSGHLDERIWLPALRERIAVVIKSIAPDESLALTVHGFSHEIGEPTELALDSRSDADHVTETLRIGLDRVQGGTDFDQLWVRAAGIDQAAAVNGDFSEVSDVVLSDLQWWPGRDSLQHMPEGFHYVQYSEEGHQGQDCLDRNVELFMRGIRQQYGEAAADALSIQSARA